MLNELTPEQQRLMLQVRNEWLAKIFDPEKRLKPNKEKADKAIRWLYKLCKLPEPHIVYVESPMGCQIAAAYIKELSKNKDEFKKLEQSVWQSVEQSVGQSVWQSVGQSVEQSVWQSVEQSVEQSVGDLKIEFYGFCWYGSIRDYGWCAYHDFFARIGIHKEKNFELFLELLNSGIYDMLQFDKICIACPMPTNIYRTEVRGNMVLHNEKEMAIEWPDGYGQHYLYGVFFDPKLFKEITSKKVSMKTILGLKNIEQRMAALKLVGSEKLIKASKAKLIDKSERGNELYEIKDVFPVTAYYLKYSDPSTNREYVSGIDPEIGKKGSADECMGWKFSLSSMEYKLLTLES